MAKLRSPNYPSMTLENALGRIKRVYDAEHTHAAAREVVAKALGYNTLNGTSLSVLGALARYGLLEKSGKDGLKVSADAVTALELGEGHPLRCEALQRLAFNPALFAELRERFPKELPSDVNLKHYLIQQKSFLPKAADEVIRIYRENLELVTDSEEVYDEAGSAKEKENPPLSEPKVQVSSSRLSAAGDFTVTGVNTGAKRGIHEFSFPLSFQRDIRATVTIYGDKLKRRDLEFLKKKVGDLLEGFEDEPELETVGEAATKTAIPEDEIVFEDSKAKGAT